MRSYAGKFDNEYEQAVIWLGIPASPKKLVNLAAAMIKTGNTYYTDLYNTENDKRMSAG